MRFPTHGKEKHNILEAMQVARERDIRWRNGKAFSLVFKSRDEVNEIAQEAYSMFFSENGLNPTAFPSLRKFETEVVAMTADLLGGDASTVGNMTSGGTESILMTVKTARDWARVHRPSITRPEVVLPVTAHPAFDKAGHYFDVAIRHIPVGDDFRADVGRMAEAIGENTILLAASAPSYPQGVVDPIPELAALALERGLLFHVDACVGGYILPFVRKLGYPLPDFDFGLPGVTSMSADIHKYGYAAKGASVILYRSPELRRRQFFVHTDWPGGIYASPAMGGTRPGGAIAAAWAVLNYLGEEGYLEITRTVMETVEVIRNALQASQDLYVLGKPHMSVMAIASRRVDIYDVADELSARGWHLDRQHFPASLHLTVNYAHARVVDEFLEDLRQSTLAARRSRMTNFKNRALVNLANALVRILPENTVSRLMARSASLLGASGDGLPKRSAAMYGLMGSLPNRGDLSELVLDLLDSMTRLESQ